MWAGYSPADTIERAQGDGSREMRGPRGERGEREGLEGMREEQGGDLAISPVGGTRPLLCRLDGAVGDGSGTSGPLPEAGRRPAS